MRTGDSSGALVQLKAFIRDAPISIAMFDRDMTYLATSDRWMKDYGRGSTDFVGRNHYECHPDLPEWWRGAHQKGLSGNTLRKDEDLWVQADGTKQWVRWTVQPWRDELGEIGGIVISAEDITDHKRAEEDLRESEQRYSAVFEASPYAIALTRTPDQVIVGVNAAFLKLFEYRREDVLGKSSLELGISDPESRAHLEAEFVARGSVRDFECTHSTKSGTRRMLSLNLDWVNIGGRKHVLTTIKDITELRQAEAKARLYEKAKELDALKDEFFANVSHEFRTPLTLILGPVEDALASPSKSLSPEGLESLHRSALRLLRLVNSLLDFSRIQAGRAQASFEPTDLATLTTDLASAFRSLVERAGLKLIVDCPPLPQLVVVDRSQWEKIVLNLISNAFKFTFRGEIAVSLHSTDHHVELSVRDTGTGIAAHELDRIFERFHRVRGASGRSFEGTGIGLSLVQELARLHGGVVHVSSVENQGSTFTVSIPTGTAHLPEERIVRGGYASTEGRGAAVPYVLEASQWLPGGEDAWSAATEAEASPSPAEAAEVARPPREAGSILVVDDNADMRGYLVRLLGTRYRVESAGDGNSALAAARAQPPDLVLADVMMPAMDGIGLLRELRADPRTSTVPVILLSARAGEQAVIEGLETRADDYLIKPFSARELLTRVRTHLEMARWRRGAAAVADHRSWLESILDLAPMPLLLLEPETARVTFANRAADGMAGGQFPKDVPAERYHEVYSISDSEGRKIPNEGMPGVRAARGEQLDGVEVVWGTPAGTFSVLVFSDTLPAVHNHPATVVIAFLDITKLKKVEGELKEAVRARDEFLSIASHELRTPLSVLVLQLAGLQRVLYKLGIESMNGKLVGNIDKALKSTARLSKLIDSLLDVSRIATGRLALNQEDVDLGEVVREVSDRFAEEVRRVGCTLRVDAPATRGEWDRLRLEQVLENLLSNALKYGSGGSVDVTLDADADNARLSVRDEGIGISTEDIARIFGRFERAVPARHYGGLGLGLYITRQIVEAHGGQIRVTSTPGAGSIFTIELPRHPAKRVLSLSDRHSLEVRP